MRPLKIVPAILSILTLGLLVACGTTDAPTTNPPGAPITNPPGTPIGSPPTNNPPTNSPPTGNPTNPPNNPPGSPSDNPASPYQGATSLTCDTRGAEALYWDYLVQVIRTDYPQTIRFLPYAPGIPFIHPQQPLYNFVYPSGWQAETLTDASQQLTGANVLRQDARAVWRRLNYTLPGAVTTEDALNAEVQGMLAFIGNPQDVRSVCFIVSQDKTSSQVLLRAGNFTAQVGTQVFVSSSPFGGAVSVVFAQVVVAPTAEYEATAVNVFFPLTGQMGLGGGSSEPECNDNEDNDGDGAVDYPDDKGCTSADDPSE